MDNRLYYRTEKNDEMLGILKKQYYPHLMCDCGEDDPFNWTVDPTIFPLFVSAPGEYEDKIYVLTSFTLN